MPPVKRTTVKSKDFKGTLKKLMLEFKPLLPSFILVAIIIVISVVGICLSPVFIQNIINGINKDIINASNPDPTYVAKYLFIEGSTIKIVWVELWKTTGIVMAFYTFSAFVSWLANWIIITISAQYAFNMRQKVKAKFDKVPLAYFDSNKIGDLLSRGTNDIDTVSANLSTIVNSSISGVTLFVAVIIIMFIVNWQLSLVVIATLPLDIVFTFFIAKKAQKQFITYQKCLGEVEGHAEEQYAGFTVVKLFNKEEDSIKEFNELSDKMKHADWKSHWFSSLIFPAMRFVNNIGFVSVSIVGGLIFDPTKIGTIAAFFVYLQLFQQPFQQIGEISSTIQLMVACAERVYILLDEKEEPKEDEDSIDTEDDIIGNISFNNVDFSYNQNKPLIQDMNLEVKQGDSIAIVGPTGAGKTTIVNLIMRFYDVNSGSIVLDGSDIKHYSREALRGSIGMVLQDTWLFNGSIKENIRYGRSDATDEEIISAAKAAHVDHFISSLPNGYDFILSEDGTNISQGQRQLITIARAIVSAPKILILDEATSSVDTRTEMNIQDAMNTMMIGRTSFIIAHRLSTIKNAKVILVMNKGQIIEKGNHKELLKQKGFYYELYNAQFSGTNPMAVKEETPS